MQIFSNIWKPWLIKFTGVEPMDTKSWIYECVDTFTDAQLNSFQYNIHLLFMLFIRENHFLLFLIHVFKELQIFTDNCWILKSTVYLKIQICKKTSGEEPESYMEVTSVLMLPHLASAYVVFSSYFICWYFSFLICKASKLSALLWGAFPSSFLSALFTPSPLLFHHFHNLQLFTY